MKKQSAVGLFFSMFLRAVVVILGLVIVALTALVIHKLITRNSGAPEAPATTVDANVLTEAETMDELLYNDTSISTEEATEAVTEEATEEPALSTDKTILVLNSTNVTGLAGRWCERLGENGYTNTKAADYTQSLETTKIVSIQDGVGKDLVGYFNGASYEVGTVTENTSEDTSTYDIVIIIGAADSDQ